MAESKRFYQTVAVAETTSGHQVTADGRPLRTPAGEFLALPTAALAAAVAAEWQCQHEIIRPHTMPLTRLASTALDRLAQTRAHVIDSVLRYAETDLLCYRAIEPETLRRRQHETWEPLLDWLDQEEGVRLTVIEGIIPVAQPAAALAQLRARFEGFDAWHLVAVADLVAALGSVVLALAVLRGRLTAKQAFAASHLDEFFQAETWGTDQEAAQRQDRLAYDIETSTRFLQLLSALPHANPSHDTECKSS